MNLKCPKCQGEMKQGFVPEYGDFSQVTPTDWIEGPPQKTLLRGTKVTEKTTIEIEAYRCSHCEFIELYAKSQV